MRPPFVIAIVSGPSALDDPQGLTAEVALDFQQVATARQVLEIDL